MEIQKLYDKVNDNNLQETYYPYHPVLEVIYFIIRGKAIDISI